MPGSYTSKDGANIPYMQGYEQGQGDLVVISSDKRAFCLKSSKLAEASKVFRYMFEVGDSKKDKELKLEDTSAGLNLFFSFIFERATDLNGVRWSVIQEPGEILLRYEASTYGSGLLRRYIKSGASGADVFELFLLASRFDEVAIGFWVIGNIGAALRYNSVGSFFTRDDWPQDLLRKLSATWVGAYAKAHVSCQSKYEYGSRVYWREVACGFLENVLAVSF
ncbi:hypothetical protein I302_101772 [Kwoniella bestiolae CBS 10118]|uniref:BTB domain-containing protein n=1 Tax=Kwoniella bestiolae CBS 10118 TaxID=1296100 RepID=A0A1B9GD73_9TREE|nr:hypothetical protein I302_00452 [Kwoniella bestiolae CBS 10118]OCF28961.1 hypothetical protein I302_00452 [Kwoniella bestiolae CBS 10118]